MLPPRLLLVAAWVGRVACLQAAQPLSNRLRALGSTSIEERHGVVEPVIRLGHGYDIHRMAAREEAGQPVIISGVRFDGSEGHAPDFELGLVAHSDGDVVYHSVVDAILGALTLPDIGQLFPDNDPRLRGADSEMFMEEAYRRMRDRGYRVGNCDVTVIAQTPRINVEFKGQTIKGLMRANLSRLLRTPLSCVNVKARTHEKVDSVGECRALECHVVITLIRESHAPNLIGGQ